MLFVVVQADYSVVLRSDEPKELATLQTGLTSDAVAEIALAVAKAVDSDNVVTKVASGNRTYLHGFIQGSISGALRQKAHRFPPGYMEIKAET